MRAWTLCVIGLIAAAALAAEKPAEEPAEGQFKPEDGWAQLFNGKDLSGWKTLPGRRGIESSWTVEKGVLANPRRSVNIRTEKTFTNFKLHIEFKVNAGGNSGVYARGRKEVQIRDSFGIADNKLKHWDCGGIYSKHAPSTNACEAPGEWQTFDIEVVGDTITVALNGKTVVDHKEVKQPTGGQLDNDVGKPGPLMLQGDHAPVWYRNIWIKPLP